MIERPCGRVALQFLLIAALAALGAGTGLARQQVTNIVGLAVSKETAPPGGMTQVKVHVTEPKPISTGGGTILFDAYESVDGIALMNHLQDVKGVALVRGTQIDLAFTSISGTFGMDSDYPVLAVAGRIPANTPIGVKYPLIFDNQSLQLFDPLGNLYAIESKPGHIITEEGLSIADVLPGSAFVPSGGVVTILGSGFTPRTDIKFAEARLSAINYIDPNRIDVVVAQDVVMHGMMIRADGGKTRCDYFSYQRTYPMAPSADPVLRRVVPLVAPPQAALDAAIAFPAPDANTLYGLAVQNIENVEANVTLELLDASGVVTATASLSVTPSHFVVRQLGELFGFTPSADVRVRVISSVPVQSLGIATDPAAGTAKPVGT